MALRMTFDDSATLSLTLAEEKTIACYVYNNETNKPHDLTAATPAVILKNADNTNLTLTGTLTAATDGEFSFDITAAQSALIKTGTQQDIELSLTVGSDVELERQSKVLNVSSAF